MNNLSVEIILYILSYVHTLDIAGYYDVNIYQYIKHNLKMAYNNLMDIIKISLTNKYLNNIVAKNGMKVIIFPKKINNNVLAKYKPTYIFAPLVESFNVDMIKDRIKGLYVPHAITDSLMNISSYKNLKYIDVYCFQDHFTVCKENANINTTISCVEFNNINIIEHQNIFHHNNGKNITVVKMKNMLIKNNNKICSINIVPYHKIFRDLKVKSDIYDNIGITTLSPTLSYGILMIKSYETYSKLVNNTYVTEIFQPYYGEVETLEYIYHPNIDKIKKITLLIGGSAMYKMSPIYKVVTTTNNNVIKVISLGKYGIPIFLLYYHDIRIILESTVDLHNDVSIVVGKINFPIRACITMNYSMSKTGMYFDFFPGVVVMFDSGMAARPFYEKDDGTDIESYLSGNMSTAIARRYDDIHLETYRRISS